MTPAMAFGDFVMSKPAEIENVTEAAMMRSAYIPDLKYFSRADHGESTGRPTELINRYVRNAMMKAVAKDLGDEGLFAELPGFPGLWADGDTPAQVRTELEAALREWLELKIADRDGDIPLICGINLNVL